jgi:ADP-ribose pyrophosphatase YjhB (NUDIX family)
MANKKDNIEFIARGVLIGPRGLLLCKNKSSDNTYLPGGHIEFGESAAAALAREMLEEMDMKVTIGQFFGAQEQTFVQHGEKHHEINLVFEMTSSAIARRAKLTAVEDHIEFLWQPIHALAEINLLPKVFRTLIPSWTRGKHMAWTSEIKP